MGLDLTLRAVDGSAVDGEVRLFALRESRGAMRPAEGRFSVRSTYDARLRTFRLVPVAWLERPRGGGRPFSIEGVFEPGQPALAGTLGAGTRNVVRFKATRPDQAADLVRRALLRPPRSPGGPIDDDGLVAWGSRVLDEHPGADQGRIPAARPSEISVNLFGDEHFHGHFGTTFDRMSERERNRVYRRLRPLMETSSEGSLKSLVRSVIRPRPSEDLGRFRPLAGAFDGSSGSLAMVPTVLAHRVVRAWAAAHLVRAGDFPPTLDSFRQLDRLVTEAEGRLSALWPSEQTRFREEVGSTRMTLYANATADLEEARRRTLALASLSEAAEGGDHEAQYVLGLVHANPDLALNAEQRVLNRMLVSSGHGVLVTPEDQAQAAVWFRRAADQGDAFAQNDLGLLYSAGRGVQRDDRQAGEWYRQAAEQGHAHAQNDLGVLYREGRGVERDEAQARPWFRQAADGGSAQGRANLQRAEHAAREAQREPTFGEALAGLLLLGVAAAVLTGSGEAAPRSDHSEWRRYHDQRRFDAEHQMRQTHIDALMSCC